MSDFGDEMWGCEDYPTLTWRDQVRLFWFKIKACGCYGSGEAIF
jgi:hypothetical protein